MMMILEITRGAEFQAYPPKLRGKIAQALKEYTRKLRLQWPEDRLLGTKSLGNKQLVLIDVPMTREQFASQLSFDLIDKDGSPVLNDGEPVTISLSWRVLAVENEPFDQSELLPYFKKRKVYDDDGNEIGTEEVTDLKGQLQYWAGKKWRF